MTTQEFSDQFDLLANSFATNISSSEIDRLAFNEYEKSVFLTKAQEQLVISLYNGKISNGDSFESSEELRRYLNSLVIQKEKKTTDATARLLGDKSYAYKLEDDVMFIIYEDVDFKKEDLGCLPYKNIQVQPITHDEYHKIKNNPFRGANSHRVLRLESRINPTVNPNSYIELISEYSIAVYRYRYLKYPNPIILENLEGATIQGKSTTQTSELNTALHEKILELAVRMALQSRGIGINNNQ